MPLPPPHSVARTNTNNIETCSPSFCESESERQPELRMTQGCLAFNNKQGKSFWPFASLLSKHNTKHYFGSAMNINLNVKSVNTLCGLDVLVSDTAKSLKFP